MPFYSCNIIGSTANIVYILAHFNKGTNFTSRTCQKAENSQQPEREPELERREEMAVLMAAPGLKHINSH